jgi:hypothetical protein
VVADEVLNVAEDLRVALVRVGRHRGESLALLVGDGRGLRVQDEWDGQQALDPFDQLVSAMRLRPSVGVDSLR